jgi:hypothetical protein
MTDPTAPELTTRPHTLTYAEHCQLYNRAVPYWTATIFITNPAGKITETFTHEQFLTMYPSQLVEWVLAQTGLNFSPDPRNLNTDVWVYTEVESDQQVLSST